MFKQIRARKDRLLTVAILILSAGLAASIYMFTVSDAPPPEHSPVAGKSMTNTEAHLPLTETDMAAILAKRDPEEPTTNVSSKTTPASNFSTMPQFIVRGIVFSTRRPSVAFIEISKDLGLYREGQSADGWQIKRIERRYVTVIRNGVERRIPVSTTSYAGRPWTPEVERTPVSPETHAKQTTDDTDSSGKVRKRTVSMKYGDSPIPTLSKTSRPPHADYSVVVAQNIVDKARTDPNSLKEGVTAAFMKDADGKTNGVVLNHVSTGSLAARYGFATGDRILAVNGQAITSYAQASKLYSRYRNDSSATITIERNGVRKDVVYYAKQ